MVIKQKPTICNAEITVYNSEVKRWFLQALHQLKCLLFQRKKLGTATKRTFDSQTEKTKPIPCALDAKNKAPTLGKRRDSTK